MKRLMTWLLSLLMAACTAEQPVGPEPGGGPAEAVQPGEADPDDICEAVFRHQFNHNASARQDGVDYYFLQLPDREDPSAEFLSRFTGHSPRVAPVSHADSSATGGVRHKDDGRPGLIFRIDQVRSIDEDTVEVDGGYYEAGLSSSGNTYRVERRSGTWTVTDDEMNWIS